MAKDDVLFDEIIAPKANRELQTFQKRLRELEKQYAKADQAARKLKKTQGAGPGARAGGRFSGIRQRVAAEGINFARSGGQTSGLISTAGTALPLGLGAIIAIPILALRAAMQKFESSLALVKETRRIAVDFRSAFSKSARTAIQQVSTFFDVEDVRKGFAGLSRRGISEQRIQEAAPLLTTFAQAQGAENLTEAINNLLSGQLAFQRGIQETDVFRLRALAEPAGIGGIAAEKAFTQMIAILKQNENSLKEIAKPTVSSVGAIQQAQNIIRAEQIKTAEARVGDRDSFEKNIAGIQAAGEVERMLDAVVAKLGAPAGEAVQKLQGVNLTGITDKIVGKIGEGAKSAGNAAIRAISFGRADLSDVQKAAEKTQDVFRETVKSMQDFGQTLRKTTETLIESDNKIKTEILRQPTADSGAGELPRHLRLRQKIRNLQVSGFSTFEEFRQESSRLREEQQKAEREWLRQSGATPPAATPDKKSGNSVSMQNTFNINVMASAPGGGQNLRENLDGVARQIALELGEIINA